MISSVEPWVDAKRVAEHLSLSEKYVNRLALLGQIPAIGLPLLPRHSKRKYKTDKRRRTYRFQISKIDAWASGQSVKRVKR